MRQTCGKVKVALQYLQILPSQPQEVPSTSESFDCSEMAQEWYQWCMAWYKGAVDLTPRIRQSYVHQILVVGRWLNEQHPEIRTPAQWTEDLAISFRNHLCSWTTGQYACSRARQTLAARSKLGKPLQANAICSYLVVLRRYFTDLTKRPHSIDKTPGRKIKLDFAPTEALAIPDQVRRARDAANPRDIDLLVWAKLVIAAATLSPGDLSESPRYPLSFYRALALIWVTSARRPNEIARLRVDCLREDWDPDMLDEDDQPVVKLSELNANSQPTQSERVTPKIYYLHIPSSKNRGPFGSGFQTT